MLQFEVKRLSLLTDIIITKPDRTWHNYHLVHDYGLSYSSFHNRAVM